MKIGISIPRLPDSAAIRRFVERAERLFRETGILKGKVDVRTHFTNALVEKL